MATHSSMPGKSHGQKSQVGYTVHEVANSQMQLSDYHSWNPATCCRVEGERGLGEDNRKGDLGQGEGASEKKRVASDFWSQLLLLLVAAESGSDSGICASAL